MKSRSADAAAEASDGPQWQRLDDRDEGPGQGVDQ
jgi:hypothetical protein